MRDRMNSVNGWLTGMGVTTPASYEVAEPYTSEKSASNGWYINTDSGNVNNGVEKYNDRNVRPCTEYSEFDIFADTMWYAYEECLKGKRSSPTGVGIYTHGGS